DLRAEGRCVMLGNLSKTFKSERGPIHAVNQANFTMYEGQILSLLGHNGAGKTTLSNMLVGKLAPSQGEVYIGGHPVSTDMATIRGSLGVCPQHNILFPNLTVKEHFRIYAGVKGLPANEAETKITEMIAEVGLTPKTHTLSKSLSGGMKRKLHLGIALLGDSKLVVLDEPTSGQDPYSRTFTWKTIERHREGRTIILTTHYMDEADLLGDRIAIMSEGKLKCIGSSLFLKKIFGVGYQMTIEKADDGDEAKRLEVVSIVARHVPSAEVLSDVGTEIMLQLPLAASPNFQRMLAELEASAERLGIVNVGISVTSLENVFLRVAEGAENVFER
ncbi:ABC transporter ATP-binding protein, partial [Hondaea fermentalgiana]